MRLEPMPIAYSHESENKSEILTFPNVCAKGDLSAVKVYLAQKGFDMNITDSIGRTGFHWACWKGKLNVVQFLVQQGFDMNVIGGNHGRTGFHLACFKGNLNVVQFFVQQGYDIDVGDNLGRTGFHIACFKGNLNVARFLIQRGFDMNVGDYNGLTGFHSACVGGNLSKFHIHQGFTDGYNNDSKEFQFACRLRTRNIVQFLIQKEFNVYAIDNNGNTGFHIACFSGNLIAIQFLIQQEFNMNVGNKNGITGFMLAASSGNLNVIRLLLKHGFDGINGRSFDGMTALEILIEEKYDYFDDELFMPCVLLLIESGAELSVNDVFEELISNIQNRIIELTIMKKIIFENWTGRIAQAITDFTMEPSTNTSVKNLSQFVDSKTIIPQSTICVIQ